MVYVMLRKEGLGPTLTMQPNRKNMKLALFAILFLMTALIFSSCANKRTDNDEPLKNLVADAGQNADTPLDNTELSEDIIISIEKPDIMGGDDENDETESGDSSADEGIPPSDEDEDDMNDFEGSGTDNDNEKDDTESSETEAPKEPDQVPPEDEEEEADQEVLGPGAGYAMYDVPLPMLKQIYVIETAQEFGIPPELIFGVMYVESRYTETAISKNGKYIGAMQIAKSNLKTLTKKFGITDLQDFQQNVTAGAYFLSYFYKKYDGDVDKVLMCYHCGEGGAQKSWRNGYYTDSYCSKVKKEMNRILANFDPAQMSGKISE